MARSTLAFALAAGLASFPAQAEPVHTLTLPEAIEIALGHNPDLRSSQQDVRSAHGAWVQSSALPNPNLFVSSLGTQVNPLHWPRPNQLGVTWTIPIGGKRGAGIASAEAGLKAAQATEAAQVRQTALGVTTAFVNLLLARSQLDFAKQDQAAFNKTVELSELQYKDGKIAYGDLLKLRIEALSTDDAVRQSQENLVSAHADLEQLLGLQAVAPDFVAQGSLEGTQAPALTVESAIAQALAHRPDYQALKASEESAKSALVQQKRQPIPDLGVLADYNHQPGDPDSFDLQLSVAVPIFDFNRGNVEQADATYEKARLAEESLKTQIRDSAIKAVAEWNTARAQVEAYGTGLKAAKESLDISRHAFNLGSGSLLDFLQAETAYRQVETSYRAALARAALAAYSLRFIAGLDLT